MSLTGGGPISLDPWLADCGALLMYWYGGTEGGNALARVLFGDVSPSAHLPCSWPKRLADSPAHWTGKAADYPRIPGSDGNLDGRVATTPDSGPQENYSEGIFVGYRWFDAKKIEPQFPFGFGLSYTTFELSGLRVAESAADEVVVPLRRPMAAVTVTGSDFNRSLSERLKSDA